MTRMAGQTTVLIISLVMSATLGMALSAAEAATSDMPQKTFTLPAVKGYLSKDELPDSLLILKSPPAPGSASEARDKEASEDALQLGHGARWNRAFADANLEFPAAVEAFDCTLGIEISQDTTPRLYGMLQRSMLDFGLSLYPSKGKYQRLRPFMVNNQPMCTPEYEDALRTDGSYPSGHSAVGLGWGLVLAAIAPDKAAQLVQRGVDFGDSRRVCNVHWLSDIEDGRLMGAAVFARLMSVRGFRKDLTVAGREYRRAVAGRKWPTRACS